VAPHLQQLRRAFRQWENRGGMPYRRSVYAHVCDAATYPVFRLFPRRLEEDRPKIEFIKVRRPPRPQWEDL
jgi:hypothetical protein